MKCGNESVLGSAHFRCSSMGKCDTYLEFDMSKDSIGAAEFGFGQPCTAQGQFKSCKGAKMSPWLQTGDNLAATWLRPGCNLAATWLRPGCNLAATWLATTWLSPDCTLATFKLSLCCTGLTKSKFSCTNRILRHAEFQICITLPHRRASEACRTQNSFIPTFSGHWSPA